MLQFISMTLLLIKINSIHRVFRCSISTSALLKAGNEEWKGSLKTIEPWQQSGWWIEDHYPRTWPDTEEKRVASARKYGLRPGDYKPLPIDACLGEYPDLGLVTYDMRDPFENYCDDYGYRRNFGEPMDKDFMRYVPCRICYTGTEKMTSAQASWKLFRFTFYIIFATYFAKYFPLRTFLPMKPKQYAYDFDKAGASDPRNFPLTHYTFEPAE